MNTEQKAMDHFNMLLKDPQSDLYNSSISIKSGLNARQAEKFIGRKNTKFKLYFEHASKELFAYEMMCMNPLWLKSPRS
jgi:hypothetical protein